MNKANFSKNFLDRSAFLSIFASPKRKSSQFGKDHTDLK